MERHRLWAATMVFLLSLGTSSALAQMRGAVAAPAPASTAPSTIPPLAVAEAGPELALQQAVRTALRLHPDIRLARAAVDARAADVLGARANLDPIVTAELNQQRTRTPILAIDRIGMETKQLDDLTQFTLAGQATLPWGTQLSPGVTLTSDYLRRQPGDATVDRLTRRTAVAQANILATQPLLRGRGEIGTMSGAWSAARDHEAALHASAYVAQQTAFGVIVAYWELASAGDQLDILRLAEARSRKLLEDTRTLVAGNQRPQGDLVQLEGHLWTRVRAVIEQQRVSRAAAHGLALAMGLPGNEPTPAWRATDALPTPAPIEGDLARRATDAREDLRALRLGVDSARMLVAGLERNALPALDLMLSFGYEGAVDRYGVGPLASSLGSNVAGLNVAAGLRLELPILNRARRASLDRQSVELRRTEVQRDDLSRQVQIRLGSALDELRLSAESLTAATQAAARYARAVEDERTKLRAGLSTVIDLLLTEDLLTQAGVGLVQSRLDYALALGRVRFEAGELPRDESEVAGRLAAVLEPRPSAGGADGSR